MFKIIIIIRLQTVSVYSHPQRDSSISPGHLPFYVSRQPRAARRCWLDGRCTLHRSSSDSLGLLCRDLAEVCRERTCWSARSLLSSSSGQHTLIAFSGFVVWEARFLCRLRSRFAYKSRCLLLCLGAWYMAHVQNKGGNCEHSVENFCWIFYCIFNKSKLTFLNNCMDY